MQDIRAITNAKNNDRWAYSAKQLDFPNVNLSSISPKAVTLRFKNTGSHTWLNNSNPILLATAEPDGRGSAFRDGSWPSDSILAAMDEPSVAPGQIGTFTFNITRPNFKPDYYYENLRLVTLSGGDIFDAHFGLPIHFFCTVGTPGNPRPDGLVVRNAANGAIYNLENGQKRYIESFLAAFTHRLNLGEIVHIGPSEASNIPDGPALKADEGTLLKAHGGSEIYIIDEIGGQFYKRHITSLEAMSNFDLFRAPIHMVSGGELATYQTGATVTTGSQIPDGLVVKSNDQPHIYVVRDGEKQWISSSWAISSNGYEASHVRPVSQSKIDELNNGPAFAKLRAGSLMKPTARLIFTRSPQAAGNG